MKKMARFFIIVIFIASWMVLSSVAFHGKLNQVTEKYSPDGKYKVVAYYVLPTTPVSLFQSIINGDVFVVLYDSNGKYIGQSSPFRFSDIYGVFGDKLFFPEGKNDDSFSINGVDDYVDGYIIPANEKRWWSLILSLIHN